MQLCIPGTRLTFPHAGAFHAAGTAFADAREIARDAGVDTAGASGTSIGEERRWQNDFLARAPQLHPHIGQHDFRRVVGVQRCTASGDVRAIRSCSCSGA